MFQLLYEAWARPGRWYTEQPLDLVRWDNDHKTWKPFSFVREIQCSSVDSTHKEPVMQCFDGFFDVSLTKLLNKKSIVQLCAHW